MRNYRKGRDGAPRRNSSDPYRGLKTRAGADADALGGAVTGLLFDYKQGEPAKAPKTRGATWEPKYARLTDRSTAG